MSSSSRAVLNVVNPDIGCDQEDDDCSYTISLKSVWTTLATGKGRARRARPCVLNVCVDDGEEAASLSTPEGKIQISNKDAIWMFCACTCDCCGVRERELYCASNDCEEAKDDFYSRYPKLKAVEVGSDCRRIGRIEIMFRDGDLLSVGLECPVSRDHVPRFTKLCSSLVEICHMMKCTSTGCKTERKSLSREAPAITASDAAADNEAERHMMELLADIDGRDAARARAAERKKNKKKKSSLMVDVTSCTSCACESAEPQQSCDSQESLTTIQDSYVHELPEQVGDNPLKSEPVREEGVDLPEKAASLDEETQAERHMQELLADIQLPGFVQSRASERKKNKRRKYSNTSEAEAPEVDAREVSPAQSSGDIDIAMGLSNDSDQLVSNQAVPAASASELCNKEAPPICTSSTMSVHEFANAALRFTEFMDLTKSVSSDTQSVQSDVSARETSCLAADAPSSSSLVASYKKTVGPIQEDLKDCAESSQETVSRDQVANMCEATRVSAQFSESVEKVDSQQDRTQDDATEAAALGFLQGFEQGLFQSRGLAALFTHLTAKQQVAGSLVEDPHLDNQEEAILQDESRNGELDWATMSQDWGSFAQEDLEHHQPPLFTGLNNGMFGLGSVDLFAPARDELWAQCVEEQAAAWQAARCFEEAAYSGTWQAASQFYPPAPIMEAPKPCRSIGIQAETMMPLKKDAKAMMPMHIGDYKLSEPEDDRTPMTIIALVERSRCLIHDSGPAQVTMSEKVFGELRIPCGDGLKQSGRMKKVEYMCDASSDVSETSTVACGAPCCN